MIPSHAPITDFPLPDTTYYWFDLQYLRVESASWMPSQINHNEQVVYVQGSAIPFSWLCAHYETAVQEGIDYWHRQMAKCEIAITKLRSERESYELRRKEVVQ